MKRCPQCGRTYTDNTYNFCLDDGTLLSTLYDPHATLVNPPLHNPNLVQTEVLHSKESARPKLFDPRVLEGLSEKEKELHKLAQRYARTLVSELKKYNERQCQEGLMTGDLYRRLQEEIIRYRQHYERHVSSQVKERVDYFYDEIVHQLCAGDPAKLGTNQHF